MPFVIRIFQAADDGLRRIHSISQLFLTEASLLAKFINGAGNFGVHPLLFQRCLPLSVLTHVAAMKNPKIQIRIALGLGKGRDRVLTCDLTKEYIAINGDYRS